MKCIHCRRCKCKEKTFNGKSKEELKKLFEESAIEKGVVINRRPTAMRGKMLINEYY